MAVCLNKHIDRADIRVNQITEHKIDDAVFAAERNSGLGPVVRQCSEAGATSPGEDKCKNPRLHVFLSFRQLNRESGFPWMLCLPGVFRRTQIRSEGAVRSRSASCRPAAIQSDIAVSAGRPALSQMKYAACRTRDSVVRGCELFIRNPAR